MFGDKALGWMAGTLIWMPGAPGKRTLSAQNFSFPEGPGLCLVFGLRDGGGFGGNENVYRKWAFHCWLSPNLIIPSRDIFLVLGGGGGGGLAPPPSPRGSAHPCAGGRPRVPCLAHVPTNSPWNRHPLSCWTPPVRSSLAYPPPPAPPRLRET